MQINSSHINDQFFNKVNAYYDGDSVYAIDPELVISTIPLKKSLETINGSYRTCKYDDGGTFGKVKFVKFQNDPQANRWFAIKSPSAIFKDSVYGKDVKSFIKDYENNLDMAFKIGNHPNFMKVHGVVVKEREQKPAKPYLILEYIDGIELMNVDHLSFEKRLDLLSQLKNALIHLFNLRILPNDKNYCNFLVTDENILKFIDFDGWSFEESSEELDQNLYDLACFIAEQLSDDVQIPEFNLNLEQSMDDLISAFSK